MNVFRNTCGCTGRDGKKKNLYRTEREADEVARHIKLERRTDLDTYACPHTYGYHLRKK